MLKLRLKMLLFGIILLSPCWQVVINGPCIILHCPSINLQIGVPWHTRILKSFNNAQFRQFTQCKTTTIYSKTLSPQLSKVFAFFNFFIFHVKVLEQSHPFFTLHIFFPNISFSPLKQICIFFFPSF